MNINDQIQKALYSLSARLSDVEKRTSNFPSRWSAIGTPSVALRVQVTTAPTAALPRVAGVKKFLEDGTLAGDEFYVELLKANGHVLDEKLYVVFIINRTEQTDVSGYPVLWAELGGTGGAVPVKITGIETGSGGKYKGRSITITPSGIGVVNAGNLAMPPSSYTIAATDDLMLYHPLEDGLSTHTIPWPMFALAYDTGLVTNDVTPRKIMELENIGVKPGSSQYDVYNMVTASAAGWGPTKAK